jgi:photosystem II stability/assembly factor-like uncharacterized protein
LSRHTRDGGWIDADFLDEQTGCISGFPSGLNCTSDGGLTWSEISPLGQIDADVCSKKFCPPSAVAMVDRNTIVGAWNWVEFRIFAFDKVSPGKGIIATSRDGGANWTSQRFEVPIRKIDFVDEMNGWAIGHSFFELNSDWDLASYKFFETHDGGSSWNEVSVGEGSEIVDFSFVDEFVGWALAKDGRLFATKNGGEDWVQAYDFIRN